MKKAFVLLTIIFTFIISGCAGLFVKAEPEVKLAINPKIANYWTSPTMSIDEARILAQFHLVIADMENIKNNRASLELLKQLNPKIKLLAYSNPMEFFVPMVQNRPLQKQELEEIKIRYPAWFLKTPDGQPVIFWQGMRMLNLSSNCPEVNGLKWNQYHADFLLAQVLNDPIWDGYFMDNSGANISWVKNGFIDSDNDGAQDYPEMLDKAWQEGVERFLTIIRIVKGDNFIVIGNKMSLDFIDILDGKMSEEFPNNYLGDKNADGWYRSAENYLQAGPYSIIQAKQLPNNPEHRIFILASALMGDGYYAYGQDVCRRFPEYQQDIGKPLDSAEKKTGYWIREFEKAIIKVWPEEKRGEIQYK